MTNTEKDVTASQVANAVQPFTVTRKGLALKIVTVSHDQMEITYGKHWYLVGSAYDGGWGYVIRYSSDGAPRPNGQAWSDVFTLLMDLVDVNTGERQ